MKLIGAAPNYYSDPYAQQRIVETNNQLHNWIVQSLHVLEQNMAEHIKADHDYRMRLRLLMQAIALDLSKHKGFADVMPETMSAISNMAIEDIQSDG